VSRSIVNVAEMKRACKRLLARLPDECESDNQSVVFTADHDSLCIQVGSSIRNNLGGRDADGQRSVESRSSRHGQTPAVLSQKKLKLRFSDNELKN